MAVGDIFGITAKPKYAFGSKGDEKLGVPPDATVYYEIELVQFHKIETLVKGISKKILKEGTGYSKPKDGFTVEMECEGRIVGQDPFYSVPSSEKVVVGEGALPEAVDLGTPPYFFFPLCLFAPFRHHPSTLFQLIALTKINKEEEAIIMVKDSDFFFSEEENRQKGFPVGPNEYEFRIKLVNFDKVSDQNLSLFPYHSLPEGKRPSHPSFN